MKYRGKLYALRILSYGDNSVSALKRKLVLKSISSAVASDICREMISLGYINESRQLEKLIENEANVRLSGRRKIFQKLLSKGYGKKEIENALDELISQGIVDFEESKRKLIEKKFPDATSEELRSLLYKSGYTDTEF